MWGVTVACRLTDVPGAQTRVRNVIKNVLPSIKAVSEDTERRSEDGDAALEGALSIPKERLASIQDWDFPGFAASLISLGAVQTIFDMAKSVAPYNALVNRTADLTAPDEFVRIFDCGSTILRLDASSAWQEYVVYDNCLVMYQAWSEVRTAYEAEFAHYSETGERGRLLAWCTAGSSTTKSNYVNRLMEAFNRYCTRGITNQAQIDKVLRLYKSSRDIGKRMHIITTAFKSTGVMALIKTGRREQ